MHGMHGPPARPGSAQRAAAAALTPAPLHHMQEFLTPPGGQPGGGGSKADLQSILAILGTGPKRPACLDKPPVFAQPSGPAGGSSGLANIDAGKAARLLAFAGACARTDTCTRAHLHSVCAAHKHTCLCTAPDAGKLLDLIGLDEEETGQCSVA